jgi:hypothetical protein
VPENTHYINRVPPQHKRPNFTRWLSANLDPLHDVETLLDGMREAFDLDSAAGAQLDVIGQITGRGRVLSFDPMDGSSPVLDDDIYRLLIKAKISVNQWDGTIPGVMELWENLFPEYRLIMQDNQDMTMDLYVIGLVTPLEQELMQRGYIAPKPMGVLVNFIFTDYDRFEATDYYAGTIFESIRDYMFEDIPLDEEAADFNASVEVTIIRDYLSEETPVNSAAINYDGSTAYETIEEVFTDG